MHRPGTTSSNLEEIGYETMKKRSKELTNLKSDISLEKNLELVGTQQHVLITGKGSKGGICWTYKFI